jgi:hypothetical protein
LLMTFFRVFITQRVTVFRYFMRLGKDIADQFHEIVIAIIGE